MDLLGTGFSSNYIGMCRSRVRGVFFLGEFVSL